MGDEKEKLVLNNMGLAYKLASSYFRKFSGVYELDDLKSVAYIGLMKAVNTFNPELNYQFSTYAYACIRTEICNYLSDNKKFLGQMYFEDPITTKSKDSDDYKLGDTIADPFNLEESVEGTINCSMLLEEINKLPGRYPEILKYRMRGMTFVEIGKLFGLSQPTISKDYNRAVNLLRIKLRDWRWKDV